MKSIEEISVKHTFEFVFKIKYICYLLSLFLQTNINLIRFNINNNNNKNNNNHNNNNVQVGQNWLLSCILS